MRGRCYLRQPYTVHFIRNAVKEIALTRFLGVSKALVGNSDGVEALSVAPAGVRGPDAWFSCQLVFLFFAKHKYYCNHPRPPARAGRLSCTLRLPEGF